MKTEEKFNAEELQKKIGRAANASSAVNHLTKELVPLIARLYRQKNPQAGIEVAMKVSDIINTKPTGADTEEIFKTNLKVKLQNLDAHLDQHFPEPKFKEITVDIKLVLAKIVYEIFSVSDLLLEKSNTVDDSDDFNARLERVGAMVKEILAKERSNAPPYGTEKTVATMKSLSAVFEDIEAYDFTLKPDRLDIHKKLASVLEVPQKDLGGTDEAIKKVMKVFVEVKEMASERLEKIPLLTRLLKCLTDFENCVVLDLRNECQPQETPEPQSTEPQSTEPQSTEQKAFDPKEDKFLSNAIAQHVARRNVLQKGMFACADEFCKRDDPEGLMEFQDSTKGINKEIKDLQTLIERYRAKRLELAGYGKVDEMPETKTQKKD